MGYKSIKTVIEKYSHLIKSGSKKVKSMKKSVSNPPLLSIFSCNDISTPRGVNDDTKYHNVYVIPVN